MPDVLLEDVFNTDAFSVITLTDLVNKMPFVPGRLGKMGLFQAAGVKTTSIGIEEVGGTLSIIPNTPRGGPANQNKHLKRTARSLTIPHFPLEDKIQSTEFQNVRAYGTDGLQGYQDIVTRRIQMDMVPKHDATLEYGRIGAIKGLILDSDGSTVIYNLFTEFGVSQATQDMTLGTSGTDVVGLITDQKGIIEDELGTAVYDHIHVLCGKTFWKEFMAHPKVATAYQLYLAQNRVGNPLGDDLRYQGFEFAGCIWEQYRGTINSVNFIAASEAYMFPVGVPGLFKTYYAPGDFVETANMEGLPRYVKVALDPMYGKFVGIYTESNPLSICTRPRVLVKLTTSN